jgi:hypothetical protein
MSIPIDLLMSNRLDVGRISMMDGYDSDPVPEGELLKTSSYCSFPDVKSGYTEGCYPV